MSERTAFEFKPLTPARWDDLVDLFGKSGACGGCWCMWWRLKRSEFDRRKGADNRRAFRALVTSGTVPGLLVYASGRPVGWCAVQPREAYPVLQRSRVLKPVDEDPVWSVTCFFVKRGYRRGGLSVAMLRAAVDHVRTHGGSIVEGYPVEPRRDRMPEAFAFTGLAASFLRAGFHEVARRSPTRPIMRKRLR